MKRRSTFFAMAVLAALALSASATQASTMVLSDSGTTGPITLTNSSTTPGQLTMSFSSAGQLEVVNTQDVTAASIPVSFSTISNFTATPDGSGDYNLSGVGSLTKTLGTGGATTTLDFTLTKLGSATDLSAALQGTITGVSSPTGLSGYDFSSFAQGGTIVLGLLGVPSGAATFRDVLTTAGARFVGSGSFVQTDTPAVPEPASVALLGIGLTGLLGVRRFFKRSSLP